MAEQRLLVVEDSEPLREAIELVLRRAGYRVFVASNGREAVEQALRHAPDLVLMDLRMPEMSGWEAARQLREHPFTARIPVVALTSEPHLSRAELQAAGFCAYLQKPVLAEPLVNAVRRCQEGAAQGQSWIELPTTSR